ncbi:hypothetical protein ACFQT0_29060 [Hymenobacter humi]|uniref:Uncharacterized protein n=1 Tax=Hymenobacter humi TaxID=1411620 RepID=A0ABW2UBR3_9BACT
MLATADAGLLSRFFNPLATRHNPYHLCIPVLLLPTRSPLPETPLSQAEWSLVAETQLFDMSMETL